MKYLTDGVHLYEVAGQRTVENYGLLRGAIRYVILRDCVSEALAKDQRAGPGGALRGPAGRLRAQVETTIAAAT